MIIAEEKMTCMNNMRNNMNNMRNIYRNFSAT